MFNVLIFFIPVPQTDNKCYIRKCKSGVCFFFTCVKLVALVMVCAHAIARIKWIRLVIVYKIIEKIKEFFKQKITEQRINFF